ncbi:MAG: enoyl-CoA hydratase/isomerase family protein [Hydrogenophaga sp.]|nr:enoyl-CoA hydratase/isomerase family protein [Hydrogenophaga sp.]
MPEAASIYDSYKRLKFDRPHPRVLRVTMDNPGKKNSIDEVMHPEMVRVWNDISYDDSVSAVILTGAGDAFCAGGNFDMVDQMVADHEVRMKNLREARDVVYNMINCSKPIVAAVRGPAVGGGLVCAILSDISVVSRTAKLIDGHTRLGLAAGDHAAIIWPLLCGMARAKYHLLMCTTLSGQEAADIGLVSMAVDDDAVQAKALEIASTLADGPPMAIRITKYTMNHWLRMAGPIFDASLAFEFHGFTGPELAEGLAAIRERRPPKFPTHSAF